MKPTADSPTTRPKPSACPDKEDFVRDVYHHHGATLLRYAASLLDGDWHTAEDVLQEATLRTWTHYDNIVGRPSEVRPWLFTVVRNLVIDRHRAWCIRPRETHSIDDLNLPVQDAADRILDTQLVLDALPQLTAQQRQILALTYYRGCPVAEIAELLDIPPGTVKSRTHYALRALRTALAGRFAATDPLIR
ncbi:sigma-70 family RNA polymerase sigma factor [Streptomyces sp. W16]|uniref:sigma-70 family RNA polymerase sigma factor n=1 Tax=Streptomyces sp. W16 TaxID=3076631 RepID=UPI00295A92FD|nr:sigma-70 family RNA polymerase sigma factor [Streptomyces sp. W16]MDV9176178.1 sigma-70 family RNA polymerase sigma factor [Streptomyces sp. W16]